MFGFKKEKTGPSSVDGSNSGSKNEQVQRVGLGLGIVALVFVGFNVLGKKEPDDTNVYQDEASQRMQNASSRNPSDKESFESLSTQVQGLAGAVDASKTGTREIKQSIADLTVALKELNNNQDTSADDEIEFLRGEMLSLRKELKNLSEASIDASGSPTKPLIGGNRGQGLILPPATRGNVRPEPVKQTSREVVILDLGGTDKSTTLLDAVEHDIRGNLSDAAEPDVFQTKDYVPPNAFAPAVVLVGVDASTGQRAQNDPLNATLLITGPARHVVEDGVMISTDLEGCIVNGAAFGDISSERVFIRLAKMTCPLGNGEVAVQEVQGHVTELGKAGVRGTVITRVGDKIRNASIAGIFAGLGGVIGSSNSGVGISQSGSIVSEIPSAKDLVVASTGQGVANAASTVTEYYVERARAVEPVISMPRGIAVEIVFINGFKPRPSEKK